MKRKEKACELAKEAKADFVKTSTGFSKSGATVEDVKLMRRVVGPGNGDKSSRRDKGLSESNEITGSRGMQSGDE